jgi:ABC-2 type transport system permease protein
VISTVLVVALACCWFLARVTEHPLNEVFSALALHGAHFQPFQQGIVHVRDIAYYVAVTYVALFGATRVLEARRWR